MVALAALRRREIGWARVVPEGVAGPSYAAPPLRAQRIGLMLFSTSKPIADANAPKPNHEAQTDDYQSKRVFVRMSGIKKNDKPACDHDHSDACRDGIQHVSETRYHCRSPLRPRQPGEAEARECTASRAFRCAAAGAGRQATARQMGTKLGA